MFAIIFDKITICFAQVIAPSQVISPSQVTPPTFVPPSSSNPIAFEISAAAGLTAPPGAERFTLRVGRVDVEGAFPELAWENAAAAAKLSRKRVSIADIFAAAAQLEHAYAEAGFVLARLTAPPQKLVDGGPVRLVVIDGFIEEVKVEGVPQRIREAVLARTKTLVGRKRVKLADIERATMLAGDFSGLRLRSALARGQQVGGSVLVLEGEHRLLTGGFGGDNRLPSSLGGRQVNGSASVNSLFGFGEQIYASLGTGISHSLEDFRFLTNPLRVIGVGAILPLGTDGFTINPEYTYSRSTPKPAPQSPATIGDFVRVALRGSYPLIRERTQTLSATGAFEYLIQHIYAPAFTTDLNADRYRVARFDLDWQARTPWGEPYRLGMQFSKGLGGRDGADAAWSNVPLSQQGASPWFTKLLLRGRISQTLPSEFRFDLIGQGQMSFGKPMFLPEQLSLEGTEAVSGLTPGAVIVDAGGTLRGELSRILTVAAPNYGAMALAPYVFAAGGLGRIYQATAVEKPSLDVGSFGLGARTSFDRTDGFESLGVGIEFAQEYSNISGRTHGHRVNVSAALRF